MNEWIEEGKNERQKMNELVHVLVRALANDE